MPRLERILREIDLDWSDIKAILLTHGHLDHTGNLDQLLVPDVELPYWGGLRVIHLPGHTEGHCGFYSDRFNLLFSGDLFPATGSAPTCRPSSSTVARRKSNLAREK